MGIQKNSQTGNYFVTYVPFVDRTKRRSFTKAPMVRPRSGIVQFFVDLFRGGPNPFLGSPIATSIDRRLKVEKRAKGLAGNGGSADALIAGIDGQLDKYVRDAANEADAELDPLDGYLEQEENCLRKCRPAEIEARLEAELDKVLNDVNSEFGPAATGFVRKRVALENFCEDNHLERTLHWGKPLTRQSIYLIAAITIFEFLLNTAFFSGSQRSGIIGGAALAILLSVTTIILGVAFGLCYQFANRKAEGHGWFGRVGAVILLLTTFYYLLLLTLARMAGEAGETHMFAAAAREVQVHPFSGLLDLPALAYFFFSIAVIAGVYRKFVDTMGHFPRLRHHRLSADRAEGEMEEVRIGMGEAARHYADEAVKAVDGAPGLIEATIIPIKELAMNYENVVDQLRDNLKDVKDAARLLISVVREYVPVEPTVLTVDYAAPMAKFDLRLAEFRARARALEDWDDIKQTTIDRCRKGMSERGVATCEELERRCTELVEAKYREWSGKGRIERAADQSGNVTWLTQGAA
ncbi:MAG TPA: hypothetical protein VGC56_07660 [Allosphingosinicella sp.]|jgi:hypothetical protein